MIKVTQLNGKELIINAELISHIEVGVNTIITLTTGNKIIVSESGDEIIQRVIEYKRKITSKILGE